MLGGDEDLWLGIDLGTQGVRALVMTSGGELVGRGTMPLSARREGPSHEQDPADWWEATAGACREALERLEPGRVCAVATDSTSGTVLLVDAAGAALTPALMYDDSRAGEQARRAGDAGQELWRSRGYRIGASWGLPKLLWMLERRRELFPGARLAHACDYVNGRLVGDRVATDWSHALKSGYDLVEDRWPHEILERLGVPAASLPEVLRPGSPLGEVAEAGARATRIPTGTPVVAGMTDGCAAQIAAGALAEGSWSSMLGTTLGLKGASRELVRDPNGVLYCHRSPDGGWLPGGASSTGAGVLSDAFPGRDLDQLGERASRHERTDVLAYPLASRGERFPFDASQAEGFMLGSPADEAEHFAALLQGLAFTERLCFDYVDLLGAPIAGEIGLTGAATRGRYFRQLRADVLGRPVRLLKSAEAAAGMAVMAASRGRRLIDTAAEMVRVRELIEPRESHTGPLLERYLGLVAELERKGWLDPALAGHARSRAGG